MYSEYIYDNRTSPLGINTNIWMWQGFDKTINYNALNNFLLDFEKELLKKPELNDGGTGVGGTTARYKHYNLLNLTLICLTSLFNLIDALKMEV